nr:hypothetical protein [Streptomyces sp. CBMA29]
MGESVGVEVVVRVVPGDGADDGEVERAARGLRAELLAGDEDGVRDVRPRGGAAPEGAKGDAHSWAALVITLAASGGVLTTLITAVSGWLARQRPDTTVVLEVGGDRITLPGATEAERARLIGILAARHDDA